MYDRDRNIAEKKKKEILLNSVCFQRYYLHILPYLIPVTFPVEKQTHLGKGRRQEERRVKIHIITVYIVSEQKERGKRVYFHIKKGCRIWTHSMEWMKIACKLIKRLSSHSRDFS